MSIRVEAARIAFSSRTKYSLKLKDQRVITYKTRDNDLLIASQETFVYNLDFSTIMQLTDFHYELPLELIARYPLPKRSDSRLLCLAANGRTHHATFPHILNLINPNDLLIFNNTRVIPARLLGHKQTGGKIEMLIERILDQHRVLAHIRASKAPKPQTLLCFPNDINFIVLGRHHDLYELQCLAQRPVLEIIETIGELPLPPYFERKPEENDHERYQTVYAQHKGSVAAPTAGLHFDKEILEEIKNKKIDTGFVTLHVGAGTFAPVRTSNIQEHQMHAEYLEVSPELCKKIQETKNRGGRIIAIGTTTARSLETAAQSGNIKPYTGDTNIFIYPGFQFRCVDILITNFHLPSSTLLMLVAAFSGYENIMQAYQTAVIEKYRFFSYGDAMWLERNTVQPRQTGRIING